LIKEDGEALKEELSSVLIHKLASGISPSQNITEEKLAKLIDDCVAQLVNPENLDTLGATVLVGRNEFYRKSILSYLTSHTKIEDTAFGQGFSAAISYLKTFEEAGYKLEGEFFVKEANLVPAKCFMGNVAYVLPKDHGYKLKKIRIAREDIKIGKRIRPQGSGCHPHLSNDHSTGWGQLCLGDFNPSAFIISKDFDRVAFKEALSGIEETLSVVNYNSSYFDSGRFAPSSLAKDKIMTVKSSGPRKLKKV